ncbi:MAG: LysM peptidoglycan-binding domain-containing protein [Anaerolineales bacterium]|nr:LysM peptidoglycan-binding domain-containing protein [Anaerolineales bacterium]
MTVRTLRLLLALVWLVAACDAGGTPARPATAAPSLRPMPSTPAPAQALSATPGSVSTPVLIASPTATPTPVTHVVQDGETLLGIALDYGVSVEALQAANPAVQVRFLSIGTLLIIPPPEGGFAIAATNLAPPPPAPVLLSQPACYPLLPSSLYCLVEARNPGEQPLENVSARLTLAGADGLPLTNTVLFAALDLIPPGGAAPMGALFQPAPSAPVAATGVEVLTGNLISEPAAGQPVAMEVFDAAGELLDSRWSATGRTRNPVDQPLSAVWVALSLYDAEGRLTGYRKQALAGPLAPGEALDFRVTAGVLGAAVDHFGVVAEGRP